MIRAQFLTMLCAFWALSFCSSQCLAQYHCEQRLDSKNSIICAPPLGSMVKNKKGKYVCGPGQCIMMSSTDEVICSAAPGGLMALDTRNRGLCVGGCVSATEALCVAPIRDPK